MKKTNYLLLVFASIVFALCVSSFADENDVSLTPKQKLAANIEKYAAEKEITDPLQASWEYHKNSPKEEWLPVWKEILLNGTLAESVTNWLNFAKVPLFFLCQVDDPTWPDDSHFLNIATEFKKLCEEPGHFTLDDFSDALLKMRTDGNCCYPACYAYMYFSKNEQKKTATRYSYNFKSVSDVLKILSLKNGGEKILLDKLEELKKGDYREFCGSTLGEQSLGDITTFSFEGYYKLIKNDIIGKWWELFMFAERCGIKDSFFKELESFADTQSNCFFLTKFYCERLGNREKAIEFLNKHFNVDKICTFTEAYPEYAGLRVSLNDTISTREEPSPLFKVLQWQLYHNPHEFCRSAGWFWEGQSPSHSSLTYLSYNEIKKKLVKPMLENVEKPSLSIVRRLSEISDQDDFKCYLRKKLKKEDNIFCALYLATLTDDPEEFTNCLRILSPEKDQVGISCIIVSLRDNYPSSCAKIILDMIQGSDIKSNPDFPYYAERFKKWCLSKNVPEVASEVDSILKNTERKDKITYYDPKKALEEKIEKEIEYSPVSTKKQTYYFRHSQSEWLPLWKRLLFTDKLPEAVANWLDFAKFPMENLKDNTGVIKEELKSRLLENCEKEGHFTFQEFLDALINAPVNEKCFQQNYSASFHSSSSAAYEILDSITFYQIADALVFLSQTNALSKVAERASKTLDYSIQKRYETNDCEKSVYGSERAPERWQPSFVSPSRFTWDVYERALFCKEYKQEEAFLKYASEALAEHPDALALLKQYCIILIDQNKKPEVVDFLKKNYPPEKIYHITEDIDDFYEIFGWLTYNPRDDSVDLKSLPDRDEIRKNWVKTQLEDNCERTLRLHNLNNVWFKNYDRDKTIAMEVVQPYLATLPKQDMLTLRRLGQISETNWFKAFVKEGWEKEKSVPFAIEEACLTEDSLEFAELLSFIAKEGCPMMGDIPFLTRKLNDDSPVSCADDMMTLIEKSGILDKKAYIGYLNYFCEWCVKKGRKDIADKITSLK
ncbi:hypothetical protein IJS98_04425 [bacterium]|nr:hypothetical protein [bacterium]